MKKAASFDVPFLAKYDDFADLHSAFAIPLC
jgi:hypothetical protein